MFNLFEPTYRITYSGIEISSRPKLRMEWVTNQHTDRDLYPYYFRGVNVTTSFPTWARTFHEPSYGPDIIHDVFKTTDDYNGDYNDNNDNHYRNTLRRLSEGVISFVK